MEEKDALTASERATMRERMYAYMAEHPVRVPLYIRMLERAESSLYSRTTTAAFTYGRLASAAFIVLIFAGVGTSYAAENALPGQALYGVKVNINEKIAGAMAVSPIARAQFDADRTARRLEEVEILAATNQLSPEVGEEIQTRINETAASFNDHMAELSESEDDATVAEDVQSDLEAKLSAHANVLTALTTAVPATEDTLAPIISTVESHVATARNARNQSTSTAAVAAAGDEDPVQEIAVQKKELAQEALGRVRKLATNEGASAGAASSTAILDDAASDVAKTLQQGEDLMQRGEYDEAVDAFQTAIRSATQTQTQTTISRELQKILPALPYGSTTTADVIATDPATGDVLGTSTPSLPSVSSQLPDPAIPIF